jgi:IS30 family transposase
VENRELQKTIDGYLFDDQSPELLSGRIRRYRKDLPYVSGRTVRKYIKSPYGRRIEAHRNRLLGKRRGKRKVKDRIKNKRMIDKRPKYIKDRKRIGDCEGDFIVSGKEGKGIIFVCADRKSRCSFLEKIFPVSIVAVERAIGRIKKRFPELKTLTFDNDLLFIHHKRLEKKFDVKIYFCHNHSPWEKPLVENRNKIIRLYIPKRSDISEYTRYRIREIEEKLQRRIMKCLNFKLPKEILEEYRKRKKKP